MHIAAFDTGSLVPCGGRLGHPLAVGAALAFRCAARSVWRCLSPDAGSNTGNWHEGLNMASIWDLPVILCSRTTTTAFRPTSKTSSR